MNMVSVDQLKRCVSNIGHWMSANRLKLNTDKTELLLASLSDSCATLSGRPVSGAPVLDAQTQNGDEPVGEYSFSGQSCLSSADS